MMNNVEELEKVLTSARLLELNDPINECYGEFLSRKMGLIVKITGIICRSGKKRESCTNNRRDECDDGRDIRLYGRIFRNNRHRNTSSRKNTKGE